MIATETFTCLVRDIADGALDPAQALTFVSDDRCGGIDLFLGRVRQQSRGRAVVGIDYDLFDPLALQVFVSAATAAVAAHGPVLKVFAAHAKGPLRVGDVAIVVAVGSPHRDAAFRACRDVVETIKHRAPIWKREHYEDGASDWTEGCPLCVEHNEPVPATRVAP